MTSRRSAGGCRSTRRRSGLLAVGWALALLAGCGQSEPPERRAPEAVAAPLPADPTELFVRNCARCHQASELQGATAQSIEEATRTVVSMRRFQGQLSPQQLEALARLIAEESGAAAAPAGAPPAVATD